MRIRLFIGAALLVPLAAAALALEAASPNAAGPKAAACRLARPGYRFTFPRDHFAHPDFETEWWYYTGNLKTPNGRRFGFELTFFRQAADGCARAEDTAPSVWSVRDLYLAHFALSDIEGGTFLHEERTNRAGPGLAGVEEKTGAIWNGNWSARLAGEEHVLQAVADRFQIRLALVAQKPPVVHGRDGVSQKGADAGRASHYVSLPRLRATGELELDGLRLTVEGTAWMDHEFFTYRLAPEQSGWDWLGLQLDDGTDLMVYRLRRRDGQADAYCAGTFVGKDGRAELLTPRDFTMVPTGVEWTSPKTRGVYPIAWRVRVPARGLDLVVETPLPAQELVGRVGPTPSYWEGAVTASGTRNRSPIAGVGYLELTGYDKPVALGPTTH